MPLSIDLGAPRGGAERSERRAGHNQRQRRLQEESVEAPATLARRRGGAGEEVRPGRPTREAKMGTARRTAGGARQRVRRQRGGSRETPETPRPDRPGEAADARCQKRQVLRQRGAPWRQPGLRELQGRVWRMNQPKHASTRRWKTGPTARAQGKPGQQVGRTCRREG